MPPLDPNSPPPNDPKPPELTIRDRRWPGLLSYLLLFTLVASLLIFLLTHLGVPFPLSIGVVLIMLVGMLILSKLATSDFRPRD